MDLEIPTLDDCSKNLREGTPWLRADAADVSVPMSLACFLLMKCLKPGLAYGRCPRGPGMRISGGD